ncbi:BIG/ATPase V1 complex, subunit S1 [Halenospora varia]|nr:BIG/ATPase V1 complex, subunit S1 [Halenospora varia]
MHLSIATLAACLASAQAFKDTSPFVLFSSSTLPASVSNSDKYLESASNVVEAAKAVLGQCSEDVYYFIHTPSISAHDLDASSPQIKKAVTGAAGQYVMPEVLGLGLETQEELADYLIKACGATRSMRSWINKEKDPRKDGKPVYWKLDFPALPEDRYEREVEVTLQGESLDFQVFQDLKANGHKYTVIYTTTPHNPVHEDVVYEPKFEAIAHMDLKRVPPSQWNNATNATDRRPLFEKYQYFTPGLFMGLLVSAILLSILYVGISAVSSLEVSYSAFDKENGPAAQKKQG